MTASSAREVFHRVAEKWQDFRSARAALAELDECDPSVVAELARDAGMDVADFRDIVGKGVGADRLMLRMMQAYGIDAARLEREAPAFFRDVAVSCSKCGDKGRCRRELDNGTARGHAAEFCPNQPSFAAII
ncbi:DUF6455 family protein [Mesorhizobium sp. J428]|uniref:DUF6455 family protein n=1 Tax=Mesorhizobium sp. J428 TaxID=2898440 RepID=UPI0021519459|nr:DUF6455 family protein [Mesorhizobium sp. J428]MCR5858387.1 DUF6455 family protein [Mesorhizobium sp. J428]